MDAAGRGSAGGSVEPWPGVDVDAGAAAVSAVSGDGVETPPALGSVVSPTPAAAAELFGPALESAEHYAAILATRGVEWGLIGPREADRLWDRHILNSLAVSRFVPDGATVIDVGSGAGLPGIPLALARPDVRVTLLEPLERRANFLQLAVAELGLEGRVRVIRDRAETHRASYDVVTCRAVSALPKLLTWTMHLFYPDGRLVALKGASAQAEVAAADRDLRRRRLSGSVASVEVYPGADPTFVVLVR